MKRTLAFPALLLAGLSIVFPRAGSAEEPKPEGPDSLQTWWAFARARIERTLEAQGRTTEAIENPKWFEQPYTTAGRMPLVDLGLGRPLALPEAAGTFDRRARGAKGRFADLLAVAREMADAAVSPAPVAPRFSDLSADEAPGFRKALDALASRGRELKLPDPVVQALVELASSVAAGHLLRERAFAALSAEDRRRIAVLLPAYFVRPGPSGENFRGYTASLDDVPELLDLVRRVDWEPLLQAGFGVAQAVDGFRRAVREAPPESLKAPGAGALFEAETFCGRIVLAGAGPDLHDRDCALLVDLGGDDTYRSHAAATSLDGPGASVLVDVSGNDRYLAGGMAQACASCGVAALADLGGDDAYVSRHYSQGAALGGVAMFCDEAGDDTYVGQLGVQGFALFGMSVFREGSGRDSYRCSSLGQGCASTLGVSILSEGGGDDVYRSGGKQGFYEPWDASCAQGAASGMRNWPPTGHTTVYGGVGFLSEESGNDVYSGYIVGQGGSDIFALGMLVDSAGDDVYSALRYSRGVGVHLGAAVAIDRKGNDVYTGFYGNNSMSLDRSSGVFLDLDGDDVYDVAAGLGYCNKPRGCSIFVDARGNDVYRGPENTLGACNPLYGEDTESTAFFFDFGGKDAYPPGRFANDAKWTDRAFGVGQDEEVREPEGAPAEGWAPAPFPPAGPLPDSLRGMASSSPLVRFAAGRAFQDPARGGIDAVIAVARDGSPYARKDLIDAVRHWLIGNRLTAADAARLRPLLDSPDKDVRLIALFAWMGLKVADPEAVRGEGRIALYDASPDVRGIACLALGQSRSAEALAFLLQDLRASQMPVRRRAAIGLAELRSPEAAEDLLALLAQDPEADVRAHCADALGALKDPRFLPALRAATLDRDGLVRFYAARSLLKDYEHSEAMEHLIALVRWDAGALRDVLVMGFLKSYTGEELPGNEPAWRDWWARAGASFDAAAHGRVYQMCQDADEAARKGDSERAIAICREIRKTLPRHAGACEEVSKALNSKAWEIAVSGKNLGEGVKLAEEAADAKADPDVVDTLAALQFLTGDRRKAEETVRKALEKKDAPADKVEMLKRRLAEIQAGKIELQ